MTKGIYDSAARIENLVLTWLKIYNNKSREEKYHKHLCRSVPLGFSSAIIAYLTIIPLQVTVFSLRYNRSLHPNKALQNQNETNSCTVYSLVREDTVTKNVNATDSETLDDNSGLWESNIIRQLLRWMFCRPDPEGMSFRLSIRFSMADFVVSFYDTPPLTLGGNLSAFSRQHVSSSPQQTSCQTTSEKTLLTSYKSLGKLHTKVDI